MRPWRGLLLCAGVAACATPPDPGPRPAFELFVLGVAQDGAVPHLGCDKACCARARRAGRRLHPVSLGVHGTETGQLLLLEATPAIDAQVALLQELSGQRARGRAPVDGMLITHAHIGHYLGLAQLGREVAGTDRMPLWVSPRFAAFLRDNAPWSQLVALNQVELRVIEPGIPFEPLPGLEVTALAVPHRDEFSDTMAYRLRGPEHTALFVPDIDRWERTGDLLDQLFEGVDFAYVDGSFYDGRELPDRDMSEIPHPPMVDSMERFAERARARPGSIRFIHFNHTNPVLVDEQLRSEVRQRGFGLAERGDCVGL